MKIRDREASIAIVREILTNYHNTLKTYSDLDSRLIINSKDRVYVLMLFGVYKNRQIHECLVHISISKDRIYFKQDRVNIARKIEINHSYCIFPYCFNNNEHNVLYPSNFSKIDDFDLVFNRHKIYDLNQNLFNDLFEERLFIIKPDATPEQLTELAKINYPDLLKAISVHPNTPASILIELFNSFTNEVLQNPSFKLLADRDDTFLEKLIEYSDCRKTIDLINRLKQAKETNDNSQILLLEQYLYSKYSYVSGNCLTRDNINCHYSYSIDIQDFL